jgi:tetratricopeptide (TPR) repeat protein
VKKLLPLLLAALACIASALATVDPAALDAAKKLFAERKLPDAQAAFEKIVATDAACAEAHSFLAQLAQRRGDTDKAIASAQKAADLDPSNADYQLILGDSYGNAAQKASIFSQPGLAKKCLAAYRRAAELAPASVRAHQSLFEFYRQAPAIIGGGTDKAMAEASIIKKLDAMQGRIDFATLYAADKKYDQALAEFDEVLKVAPDDYGALYQVGKLAATSGQFLERGATSLRRCLELTPPAPNVPGHAAAQWRLGQIREKQNDPAGARAAYETALSLDPKFSQAADSLKKLK